MKTKSQKTQTQAPKGKAEFTPSPRSTKSSRSHIVILTGKMWNGAADKLFEECEELKPQLKTMMLKISVKNGDVLFSAVNVARFLNIDSEITLYDACDKFTDRFSSVEKLENERGIDMKIRAPLSVLDSLWDEVKLSKNY